MIKFNRVGAIVILCAIGILAITVPRGVAQMHDGEANPTTDITSSSQSDRASSIAQEKLQCALRAIQFAEQMRDKGMEANLSDMALWSRRMMDAQLGVATTGEQKAAASNDYVERMRKLEAEASRRYERGLISLLDRESITYQRIEAEQAAISEESRTK
jgi:hypothetical protein